MEEKLLSICISTYNRSQRCCNLVMDLLRLDNSNYNIVVCDDGSTDDTVERLQAINDNRVLVKTNLVNKGACKNWYHTIDSGTGKYILHILDRDIVNIPLINKLIKILEKEEISGGYIGLSFVNVHNGEKKAYEYYKQGKEAFLKMAGVPIHPTGFFLKRELWKKYNYRQFFYLQEKYGIYPHSYVIAKLALEGDLLYIPQNFFKCINSGKNKKSRFYGKSNQKNYWWLPEQVLENALRSIFYLAKYCDKEYKELFLEQRFQEELYRATVAYKVAVENKTEMERYGESTINVTRIKMLSISTKHFLVFLQFFLRNYYNEIDRKKIIKIWFNNLKEILSYSDD